MLRIPFETLTDLRGRVGYANIELREHGILVANRMRPWSEIRRYEWLGERPVRLKIVFNDATMVFPIRYESDLGEINQILSDRVVGA